MPFRYSREFRLEAVQRVRDGARPVDVASALSVNPTTIYDWLRVQAPDLVNQRDPGARCWRCHPDVLCDRGAYAHLLGLYLGDGWLSTTGRAATLSIYCDDAWPVLADACEAVMRNVLATSVCRVSRQGCHEIKGYSGHWTCLFPQHGPGKKHLRTIELQPWQQAIVAEHPGPLLRGLIHRDGWRGQNVAVRRRGRVVERRYDPRYDFMSYSDDIRGICCDALDQLGIAWRPNGPWRISVARREAVAVLDLHVGPKA